jgi:hypothetical protein
MLRASIRIQQNEVNDLKHREAIRELREKSEVTGSALDVERVKTAQAKREATEKTGAEKKAKKELELAEKKAKKELELAEKKAKKELELAEKKAKKELELAEKKAKEEQKAAAAEAKKKAKEEQKASALEQAAKRRRRDVAEARSSGGASASVPVPAMDGHRSMATFVKQARKAANDADTKYQNRFEAGELSEPERPLMTLLYDDQTIQLFEPLSSIFKDMKCMHMRCCNGRYFITAMSIDNYEYTIRCDAAALENWKAGTLWLEQQRT